MTPSPRAPSHSSGDLTADRRRSLAREYLAAGEPQAAAELMEQALELVPDWVVGWFELAEFREAAGDRDGAVAAYERCLFLDAEDHCGASLRLVRLQARAAPAAPPAAHVRDLFDGYAGRFEKSLVEGLGYRVPEDLAALLAAHAPDRRFAAALDLGCGTGLMAPLLRPRVDRLEGVDLSSAMVEGARAKGLYDALAVAELVVDLTTRSTARFDLVVAADVFCYLGDLAPAFGQVARVLAAGGLFAFSVEALSADESDEPWRLRDSLRYAHAAPHVETLARAAGLAPLALHPSVGRRDRGRDVAALLCLFTKP
jgi:predicted TPR repeat methyltransferase